MVKIDRREVIMPGGVELTLETAQRVDIRPGSRWLSVACGTGELELYLAEEYGCTIVGVDTGEWAVEGARKKAAATALPWGNGGPAMIQLTQLSGEAFVLNADLIQYVEQHPDTFVTLTSGERFIVKESMTEVVERAVKYQQAKYLIPPPPARPARAACTNFSETH